MPKLDEAKEKLGLLKFWLGVIVATFLAIAGWLANNYEKISWFKIIVGLACLVALLFALRFIYKKIWRQLKEIRDL